MYAYKIGYMSQVFVCAIVWRRYLPNNTALSLAHPKPAGAVRVRWWDPSSNNTATTPGACVTVTGGVHCAKPKAWEDALAIVE